jgi:hypothetical protein
MAVPSTTNVNRVVVRSAGYAEAFYDFMTGSKGGFREFEYACRGGAVLEQAAAQTTENARRARDKDRTSHRVKLLALISM